MMVDDCEEEEEGQVDDIFELLGQRVARLSEILPRWVGMDYLATGVSHPLPSPLTACMLFKEAALLRGCQGESTWWPPASCFLQSGQATQGVWGSGGWLWPLPWFVGLHNGGGGGGGGGPLLTQELLLLSPPVPGLCADTTPNDKSAGRQKSAAAAAAAAHPAYRCGQQHPADHRAHPEAPLRKGTEPRNPSIHLGFPR